MADGDYCLVPVTVVNLRKLLAGFIQSGTYEEDVEDVELARQIALQLGMNPIEVTPPELRRSYTHKYEPTTIPHLRGVEVELGQGREPIKWGKHVYDQREYCKWCTCAPDDPVHV